jgi:hypothetical protein
VTFGGSGGPQVDANHVWVCPSRPDLRGEPEGGPLRSARRRRAGRRPDRTELPRPRLLSGDPLWRGPEAVEAGRVYEVSDHLWMLGLGYKAANGVVDDLERYLIEERQDS